MLYIYPDYYKDFQCTADACEDTCCAGWQICIDDKALRRYRKEKSSYYKELKSSIDWRKKMFRQKEGKRCAFLRDDNLCDMYKNLGEQSLCRTCRLYPRHIEEFEGVREISLSASCPEVARMLLTRNKPVRFISVERDGEEEYEDFDPFLYSVLVDAREIMLEVLQKPELPVDTRILIMLGIAWDTQRRVDKGELFACEDVFEKYRNGSVYQAAERKKRRYEQDSEGCFQCMERLFGKLYELELLKEDWYLLLKETEHCLYKKGSNAYQRLKQEFEQWVAESSLDWEMAAQQLCVYYIYTYFCGSVYDGKIYAQAQMAAAYVYLVKEMLTAKWALNNKTLEREEIIEVVYRFSRELEHSDNNLVKWEKLFGHRNSFYNSAVSLPNNYRRKAKEKINRREKTSGTSDNCDK